MRMRSEFENELNENKVQFARTRDKNINFILCQFHSEGGRKHGYLEKSHQRHMCESSPGGDLK